MQLGCSAPSRRPQRSRLRVTGRFISRQVARIKPAAGAGPSGWRNSHLQCIYAHADGPAGLAAWCAAWADGRPVGRRPLDGRPVQAFLEGPGDSAPRPRKSSPWASSFSAAVCISQRPSDRTSTVRAAGRRGAGGRGGARGRRRPLGRPAPHPRPQECVSWILALEAVVASAPRLAPALAAQWASGHVVIFARRAASAGWTAYAVTGGFFQGNVEAHPVFCIVFYGLTAHVARVMRAPSTLSMRFWRYVDDWVIQVTWTARCSSGMPSPMPPHCGAWSCSRRNAPSTSRPRQDSRLRLCSQRPG